MISINRKVFLISLLIGILVFSVFTGACFEMDKNIFSKIESKKEVQFYVQSSGNGKGYYKQDVYQQFEPGIYHVRVEPVGKNITLVLKSCYETVERSVNDSCEFDMKIGSNVWFGIMVDDPPRINFTSTTNNRLTLYFLKDGSPIRLPIIILGSISATGGVIFAVKRAHIYRKKSK